MRARLLICLFAIALIFDLSLTSRVAIAQSDGVIIGRVIDADGGLPIPGVTVEALSGTTAVAKTTTKADGGFELPLPSGTYSLTVRVTGYQTTRVPALHVGSGERVSYQMALRRSNEALTEVGRVAVASRSSFQTSSTINESVPPSIINQQNYMRAGDVLSYIPGLTGFTGSSQGDDLAISVRGFDSTETATLLDGHPIGPIGAHGTGYDYQVSPFWGLESLDVIYGSGATGVYGATTIAGAVNFSSLNPTTSPHFVAMQGIGENGKLITGLQATGTIDRFGYALASGVSGTYGNFAPQYIEQTALLGTDLTAANRAANTYVVTGNYNLRNNLAKLVYNFDPKTQLSLTGYFANSWDDKSGNGDNDFNPLPYSLYTTETALASNPVTTVTLPNGKQVSCTNTVAVLSDAPAGYSCLPAAQYAAAVAGPSGGGPGPWQAINNQDYHGRLTHTFGVNQVTADYYEDYYGLNYNRSEAGGGFHTDFFRTYGFLIGDEIASPKNDLGFGYNREVQQHTGDVFPYVDTFGNTTNVIAPIGQYNLPNSNYYVRDAYAPNGKLTFFANLWLNSLQQTTTSTSFDPRLAVVYRPTNNDVLRIAGGRANSAPDPILLYGPPSFNTTPQNINPVCGAGNLNAIGNVSNPLLYPETADDLELSYNHRFLGQNVIGVDIYETYEHNALFDGDLPLSALGQTQVPQSLINQYLARIAAACHNTPTAADLAVTTTYNAANARYQGFTLSGVFYPTRHFIINADYNVQSGAYLGVPDSILQSNPSLVNGGQIVGIPLQKAGLTLEWLNRGLDIAMDNNYVSVNNPFARPGYAFANFTIADTIATTTLNIGINNAFNSHYQQFGYFGLGVLPPQNQFSTNANAFEAGTEVFGLPPRQVYFSITERI